MTAKAETARSPVNGAPGEDCGRWRTRRQRRAYYRCAESPVNGAGSDFEVGLWFLLRHWKFEFTRACERDKNGRENKQGVTPSRSD